jgi:ketosteroid isomerase-like protein
MLMVETVDLRPGNRVGKEKLLMSEQENTQLVQQEYRAFQNGDIPSVLGSLSSDVEWVVPHPKGVPLGGTYHGVEEVSQFFSSLGDIQEARQFEPREFVAQDDRVVALGHYAWHVNSTGREWESDFAHVFTVKDGKVTRFQEYTDSAAIVEAFREG